MDFFIMLAALAAATPAPTLSDVAMVRDLVLKDQSYRPKARREALMAADRLPALMRSPARFELEVARIIAIADNGHSALFPAGWTLRYPRSPVRLGLFADGLYVIDAPADQASAIGQKVLRINGRPWRQLHRAYSRYQGGTQAWRDHFVGYFLETPAMLAAAGFGSADGRLHLGLTDRREISVQARLEPLSGEAAFLGEYRLRQGAGLIAGELPLYLTHADEYYWFEPLPALDAAYIRIDAIGGSKLEAFLEGSLNKLRSGTPRNIILDLRFNHGGDLNRARAFANALPALANGGKVFAITSGGTFSAAISTLGYLRQAGGDKVVIVGEPIGDRLEFWAEGAPQELPGLGSAILVATERHNYTTGCPEADCHGSIREHPIRVESLMPDIPAPLTFVDYRAGRDPAMLAISQTIRSQR